MNPVVLNGIVGNLYSKNNMSSKIIINLIKVVQYRPNENNAIFH